MTTPSISVSRNFLNWLHDEKISIALTTYQTNRLFLLGRKPDGGLSAFERVFDRPMGLFVKGQSIYLSTRYLLWRLDNVLPTGELYEGYDRLYIPRSANNTGDIDIHDVVLDKDGTLICANTEYSCLARLDERHSFKVFWQPLFISQLVPEDRCHLNGIALVDGRAKYVTAVSNSDTVGGWRKKRSDGGLLIDIDTNDVILDSLSMPHSPRWYKGRLWVLNSGAGELGWVDCAKGSFTPVCFCPGYLRGLTFHKNFAIAGLSKPRKRTELSDLPFERELQRKNTEPLCGLMCIDLDTGNIAHWLEFDSVITEIYDIQILHGVIQPMLFGLMSNEIARTITFEEDEKIMRHTIFSSQEPIEFFAPDETAKTQVEKGNENHLFCHSGESRNPGFSDETETETPLPRPLQTDGRYLIQPVPLAVKFRLSTNMTFKYLKTNYDNLLFVAFNKRAGIEPPKEPLTTVVAELQGDAIGMALAERSLKNSPAEIVSLFVKPQFRKKGIGTLLIANMEKALKSSGCPYIDMVYNSGYPGADALGAIIKRLGWQESQKRIVTHRYSVEKVIKQRFINYDYRFPKGFSIFSWAELTEKERREIARSPWLPHPLTPFQVEDRIEWQVSHGLRCRDGIVGWIIVHRINPETAQISALYLKEGHRHKPNGFCPAMIARCFKAADHLNIPYLISQIDYNDQHAVNLFAKITGDGLIHENITLATRKNL